MSLDISELGENVLGAASSSLGTSWEQARRIAEPQLRELARIAGDLGQRVVSGALTEAEAKALFSIHVNTTKTVLLAVEGLGILAVEAAINAVLDVLKATANTALGFDLV
jgi:hypothetical protein